MSSYCKRKYRSRAELSFFSASRCSRGKTDRLEIGPFFFISKHGPFFCRMQALSRSLSQTRRLVNIYSAMVGLDRDWCRFLIIVGMEYSDMFLLRKEIPQRVELFFCSQDKTAWFAIKPFLYVPDRNL